MPIPTVPARTPRKDRSRIPVPPFVATAAREDPPIEPESSLDHADAPVLLAGSREAGARCPHCAALISHGEEIQLCPACGTVHHRSCWLRHQRCGSYACAPARRPVTSGSDALLVITEDDLSRSVPLLAQRPRHVPLFVESDVNAPKTPRVSRLAIAALATAIAGIPLFGVVTGLVAVILACIALGGLRTSGQKGFGLAVSGLLLGLVDVVGWLVFLSLTLSGQMVDLRQFDEGEPDVATAADVAPKILRAMKANVLLERAAGWLGKAMGSGVILAVDRGEAVIVTNRHVVDPSFPGMSEPPRLEELNKRPLLVKLLGHPQRTGRVDWIAPGGIDLALVRAPCPEPDVQPALWAPHHPAHVGDPVFAIGNPQGLSWSHTQGVISQFRALDIGGRRVRVVQTQAPINQGNSGGGLYDDAGYLIGINTWTQDKRFSEGLSFAIAFDTLLDLDAPGLTPPPVPNPPLQP